jgi:hypothetical protein
VVDEDDGDVDGVFAAEDGDGEERNMKNVAATKRMTMANTRLSASWSCDPGTLVPWLGRDESLIGVILERSVEFH